MAKYSEDLAREFRTKMLERTKSKGQAGRTFLQYWLNIIDLYPDQKQLKARIVEPSFQLPEFAVAWYQHIQSIAKSFVK